MSAPTTQRACPSCGVGVLAGDRFCPACGASLGTSATATSASPWDTVLRRLRAATLGEFEIKRELGRGGMAAVYLAHDIALDLKVAIKVMAPGIMMGEGMVDRFRLEAVTVANLSHPNIVRVHALRQVADDLHFIVMQYVPGRTLERVVHDAGPLPLPIVRTILGQVGRALAHAHKRGVVHRDVKPGNIMLDANGDVVVTDFGIAKVATAPAHTLTGSVVGTPAYMSPEQCFAQPLTGASDQYSLGVVAFEMLTGRVPFTGPAYTVMQGHTLGEIPAVRSFRPDCPGDLEAAVTRMLAKAPEDRFPSMSDAVAAAGAPAPGEQDPLRDELVRLAAIEEAAALDARYPTPISPVPQTRASVPRVVRPPASRTPRPPAEPPVPAPLAEPAPQPVSEASPPVTAPLSPPAPAPASRPAPPPVASSGSAAAPPGRTLVDPAPIGVGHSGVRHRDAERPAAVTGTAAVRPAAPRPSRRGLVWGVPAVAAVAAAVIMITRPWEADTPIDRDPIVVPKNPPDGQPKGPDPGEPARPATLRVADVPLTVAVGDTFTLGAIFSGPDSLAVVPNSWLSRAPRVLQIDPASGRARALREGVAVVAIRRGTLTDSVALRVLPSEPGAPPVTRLVIGPPPAPLRVADRVRLLANEVDDAGRRRAPSTSPVWSSSNPSVATVDPSTGDLTARSAGRAVITARAEQARATLAIVVAALDPPPTIPPPQPKETPRDSVVARPPNPEPARERPPPAKTPAELRAEIDALVETYARAFEAEDLARLRAVNTTMAAAQVTGFRDFFEVARDVNITVERIEAPAQLSATVGSEVRVRVRYRIEYYNTVTRRTARETAEWQVMLERTPTAWRVLSIR